VLVVDDEPLARQRLADLLAGEPSVEVVGEAEDGDSAVAMIRALNPDLVFLDVQMPGKTGLDVISAVGAERMPVTVFVTAYDQYALRAFDLAAVDYLVKPFDDERFEQAFRRARRMVELAEVGRLAGRLAAVLHGPGALPVHSGGPAAPPASADSPRPAPRSQPYADRIPVEMRGQVRLVPVAEVDFITASGPYAELHAGGQTYVIRETMNALEERLDPAHFFRIHRSVIVQLDRIEALLRGGGGDYSVRLKGGVRLKVSRTRVEELERTMGLTR
jgi:two-component system LytT family response regulator